MTERHWAIIGQILLGVTVVGGFVFSIWRYWQTPTVDLVAEVRFVPFSWPSEVKDTLEGLEDALSEGLSYSEQENNPQLKTLKDLNSSYVFHFETLWYTVIRNEGELPCKAISLKIPSAKLFKIDRDGADSQFVKAQEVINLGDLRPKEELIVHAWTSRYFFSIANLRISHESGIGSVVEWRLSTGIIRWLDDNYFSVVPFSIIVELFILLLIGTVAYESGRKDGLKKQENKSSDSNE